MRMRLRLPQSFLWAMYWAMSVKQTPHFSQALMVSHPSGEGGSSDGQNSSTMEGKVRKFRTHSSVG